MDRKRILMMIAVPVFLMIVALFASKSGGARESIEKVERSEKGSGSRQEELQYELEDGTQGKITLDVPEQVFTGKQVRDNLERAAGRLEEELIKICPDFPKVDTNLALPDLLEDIPVGISWNSDNPLILNSSGEIGAEVSEEGEEVVLSAELNLQDEKLTFERTLVVYPKRARTLSEKLLAQIRAVNQEEDRDYYYLPDKVGTTAVRWLTKPDHTMIYMLLLSGVVAACLFVKKYQDAQKKKIVRSEQMQEDYPEVVSKFLLLVGAGLSIRSTFARIASDYAKDKEERAYHRYIYEEITITSNEIARGVSEIKAYDNFGKRCAVNCYRTMAILLAQSLRKGSSQVLEQLEREAQEAFTERKRSARVKGEKAATKLLVPMAMMLFVVLIIIMVPACLSFGI